jgi:hypothetical protein
VNIPDYARARQQFNPAARMEIAEQLAGDSGMPHSQHARDGTPGRQQQVTRLADHVAAYLAVDPQPATEYHGSLDAAAGPDQAVDRFPFIVAAHALLALPGRYEIRNEDSARSNRRRGHCARRACAPTTALRCRYGRIGT